jgi:hypothetical protein
MGEMQEWFNWHAWKACVPQKGTGGSNPPLSAKAKQILRQSAEDFVFGMAEQNVFCKGHSKNKITWFFTEKPGLLWLCRISPRGSTKLIPQSERSLHQYIILIPVVTQPVNN